MNRPLLMGIVTGGVVIMMTELAIITISLMDISSYLRKLAGTVGPAGDLQAREVVRIKRD